MAWPVATGRSTIHRNSLLVHGVLLAVDKGVMDAEFHVLQPGAQKHLARNVAKEPVVDMGRVMRVKLQRRGPAFVTWYRQRFE